MPLLFITSALHATSRKRWYIERKITLLKLAGGFYFM